MMRFRFFILTVLLCITTIASHLTYANTPAKTDFTQRQDVQAFIDKMVKKHHFNRKQLVTLFSQVKLRPQVLKHINKPLEKEAWRTYQMLFVNEWRIEHGVKFWNQYADALRRAEQTYGVPASIIVATIGVETKYGQRTGDYRVIDSLSNIAFSNSTRSAFFTRELEEFLMLTREQHLDPLKVTGSYAGAIGQPQFMPSSYRYYAVNFSGTGKIDLMNNEVDVIGSIANYYKKHGWTTHGPVATQAIKMGGRYSSIFNRGKVNQQFTIAQLAGYGIVPKINIEPGDLKVKIIELESHYNKEYWLGFHNFDVIKRYNSSDLYAMAVYQLSNYITALRGRQNNG